MNSLYNIMAIAAILSLPFCKSNENDPGPTPPPGNGDTPGITYAKDNSPLPDTITLTEEDSNSNMVEYTIVLNTQPTANVEIKITLPSDAPSNLNIASGSQNESGAGSSITLTFATDTWDTPQRVSLTLVDDDIISRDASVTITHSSTSNDSGYDSIPDHDLVVTTKDEDTPCDQPGAGAEDDFTPNIAGENYGAGMENDPYIICNADQLQAMRDDLNAYYELGQDIDASSVNTNTCPEGTTGTCTGFQPIGRDRRNRFRGTLDGKGFTINGLTINIDLTSSEFSAGLFGYIFDANIRNIGLLNVDIDASTSASGTSYAGGLVGVNERSTITNSYSTGNVSSSASGSSSAGGLIGSNSERCSIANSYSTGNVSSTSASGSSSAGGLVGDNNGSSSITNSYSTGNVSSSASGSSSAGGLVAFNSSISTISNSYSTGNVDSSASGSSISSAGGLAGQNTSSSSIANSYSTGNVSSASVSSSSSAGGLVGDNNGSSSITNSYSTGNVSSSASGSGISSAGGLVAFNSSISTISNSYSTGNVSSSTSGNHFSYAGGLVGRNTGGGSISNSYSTGNISSAASGSSYAGGLVGWNTGGGISNSYSTGNVSSSATSNSSLDFAHSYAGGLVGQNNAGSITNSYSTGNASSSASITFSFDSFAGGLVGENSAGSITNSYYDQDTSTLFRNGSEILQVNEMAVASNESGTLTCVGGFASSSFTTNTSIDTGTCDDASPTIFFNWQTPFDIDNADSDDDPTTGTDEFSVRYDSNNDENVTNTDDFVWNFGTTSKYPFIASIPQTEDEQAVRMASGLRFSNTTLGRPSATDFVFFYDIDDAATSITTSGQSVQGTTANGYEIQDAVDAAGNALTGTDLPTVTSAGVINGVGSLLAGAEFYLKATFTRGASPNTASFTRRYRFKK